MSRDDWYRNEEWNEQIESAFFANLKRARSLRDQYIVVQALILTQRHPSVALRLIDHYFETRKESFHDTRALSAKAQALRKLGKVEQAIKTYHDLLTAELNCPNFQTNSYVEYPYFIATSEIKAEYKFALDVLARNYSQATFPLINFMWHAAKALIEKSAEHAEKALHFAQVKKSGFRFHQDLGLVGKEHKETIKKLIKICT